jgi:HlyD family secretion protein
LRGTEIVAPTAGTILSVAGTVGTVVNGPGSSGFVTIGDLNEYQVQANFSESDVAKLKIGQPATVTLAAGNGGPYQGTVSGIAPSATTTGNLVQFGVDIAFDDQPAGLLIGQTATVQVTVQQATDTLYVPNDALRTAPNGAYQVVVRSKDGTPRLRTVTVGVQGDQDAEITSGLVPGDRIETT